MAVTPTVPPARVAGDRMLVTWIGHASVLVQTERLNILTDPIWSERASPFSWTGPKRVTAPGIDFDPVNGKRFIRFSFAVSTSWVEEAIRRIGPWFAARRKG